MLAAPTQVRDEPSERTVVGARSHGFSDSALPGLGNRAVARLAEGGRGARSPQALRALSPQLGNRALARLADGGRGPLLQRAQCDRPATPRHGVGRGRETDTTAIGPSIATLIGDKAWELLNFDIDKPYTKKEHEDFIKADVVPKLKKLIEDKGAYVAVVGEASSTASDLHNLALSKKRAECVMAILRRELLAAKVMDTSRVLPPIPAGEFFSQLRSGDETENEDDRRVTILAVERDPETVCPESARLRTSKLFKVKVACDSPRSILLNIGDVSDPKLPTWRAFKWIRSPSAAADCGFAATSGNAASAARREFQLALRAPDDPDAPSDLAGEANFNVGLGWLFNADGKFSVKLPGAWTPPGCKPSGGELPGWLIPVGPVYCGEVPQPARGTDCDVKKEECTDAEKLAPAVKFGALMERVGVDLPISRLTKRLPPVARHLLDKLAPELGVALVHIGTLDGPEPRRTRTFLFVGFSGDASGLDGQVGVEKEVTSASPMSLATEDPGIWDSDSDFDSDIVALPPAPAKLEIRGGDSNVEELHVGGMTFTFAGAKCNSDSRTLYGWFGGVTAVSCSDLGPLIQYEPERDCESENCPADRQLAGHDGFDFKFGRAALSSLPVGGKKLADRFGCEVTAAYVNIGSRGDAPIYREFLFIGKRKGCRFDVTQGSVSKSFSIDRQLSLKFPEDPLDLSDFTGFATLEGSGRISVRPASVSTGFSIPLPGQFDSSCKGLKLADGVLVPMDDVKCGEVPEPAHDTTPDPDPHASCRDYTTMDPLVENGIKRLKDGDFDDILDVIPDNLGFGVIYYTKPLSALFWTGGPIRPAVFAGKNFEGVPIVTFVEMQVVSYKDTPRGPIVIVEFLSDACSYDMDGNPRFVQPVGCKEGMPYKGMIRRLRSLPAPADPSPALDPDTVPSTADAQPPDQPQAVGAAL